MTSPPLHRTSATRPRPRGTRSRSSWPTASLVAAAASPRFRSCSTTALSVTRRCQRASPSRRWRWSPGGVCVIDCRVCGELGARSRRCRAARRRDDDAQGGRGHQDRRPYRRRSTRWQPPHDRRRSRPRSRRAGRRQVATPSPTPSTWRRRGWAAPPSVSALRRETRVEGQEHSCHRSSHRRAVIHPSDGASSARSP